MRRNSSLIWLWTTWSKHLQILFQSAGYSDNINKANLSLAELGLGLSFAIYTDYYQMHLVCPFSFSAKQKYLKKTVWLQSTYIFNTSIDDPLSVSEKLLTHTELRGQQMRKLMFCSIGCLVKFSELNFIGLVGLFNLKSYADLQLFFLLVFVSYIFPFK